MKRLISPFVFALAVMLGALAPNASASHFRFANLSWKRAPGANALAVEITVTEAWRIQSGGIGEIFYNFGDGSGTFTTSTATRIATLADTVGEQYEVWRYTTTHTYPSNGVFQVRGSSCCRIGSLVNAADDSETLTLIVDLRDPTNTGSPVTTAPVILQMQAGTNNSIALPIVDPDGDAFTVRLATSAESSIFTLPSVGGNLISVSAGGVLNWNTVGGLSGQKFALQVIIEERRAGNTTGTNGLVPLDFIIELAGSLTNQPPTVTGTNGSIVIAPNRLFTASFVGTDPNGRPLRVNHQGLPPGATITPADGTTNASPSSVTFSWTPAPADIGSSYAVLIFFTDDGGLQTAASFALTVSASASVRDFELLSIHLAGTASGSGASLNPVVSSNGQYVAFVSDAGNLVSNDNNGTRDVFWRDRLAGTTRLVSRTPAGFAGNRDSDAPVLSPDGRYVAFHSRASDLVANDSNTNYDVFIWDSADNSVTLVSRTPGGISGAGDSFSPQLSANGRVVSFASTAANLVANDTNGTVDAFARDLNQGVTYLASINPNGFSGNGSCGVPVLSANGRYVAFLSRAGDLVTNDFNNLNDAFVHDLQTRETKLVSVNAAGTAAGNRLSFDPVISADGRYIAFASQATNLVTITDTNDFPDVFVRDMQLGVTKLVSVNGSGTASGGNTGIPTILPASYTPFLSADGTKVLFVSSAQDLVANDSNGKQDVFLRDHIGNTTTLISTNRFGLGSGNAASGIGAYSMSADLRYIAFFSEAANLGAADTNNKTDVFLRDLTTNSTKIISRVNLGGFSANGHSYQPVISADGSTILFTSEADNLDNRDTNKVSDVFAAATTLGAPSFGVADVGVSISSVTPRTVGGSFTLTITVTNHSATPATGLLIGNTAPEFLQFVSGTASQGIVGSNTWLVGDLPANGRATATLTLVATRLGEGNLIASIIRRDQLDSNLNNNAVLSTVTANQTASGALFYLPTDIAYLSRTNSPFFAGILAGTVTLETFESGTFNIAGVTASSGSVFAPSGITDSVDADDGAVDGSGIGGHSFFVTGTNAVTFSFNAAILGRLPTKVGIVLTDGDHEGAGIEAFDTNGVSLGVVGPAEIGDHSFFGETAEDRFLGVEFAGGISALRVYYASPGFELDHLQFDIPTTDLALSLTGSTTTFFGTNFLLTYAVTNRGSVPATGVIVTNGTSGPVAAAGFNASQGSVNAGGTWTVGTLAPGAFATLAGMFTPTGSGSLTFAAGVSSAVGDSDTANNLAGLSVTVPNQAPNIRFPSNNLVLLEDLPVLSLPGFMQASPQETNQSTINVAVSVDNPGLFTVQPAIQVNGTLSLTLAANQVGTTLVTVIAQDNGGTANGGVDKTTNTFTITVTPVNDPPSVTFMTNTVVALEDAGAQTVAGFAAATLGGADEAGQSITSYTLANNATALFSVQPAIALNGTLTFTPAANKNGSATVTVIAQDNGGTTDGGVNQTTNTFTITLTPVNDAPSLTFATNVVVVLEDAGLQTLPLFVGAVTGPADEAPQTITNYTVTAGTSSLFSVQPTVDFSGKLIFTTAANATGSSTVTVIAQDDGGTASGGVDKTTNTFTITVTPVNDAPTVTFATNTVVVLEDAGAQTVAGFAAATLGGTDEAGQSITNYTVANNATALFSVQPAIALNGTLTFTPAASKNGSATVTVIAQDNGGTTDGGVNQTTNTFTITLTPVNDAPTVTFATNTVVVLEDSGNFVGGAGFASFSPGPADESGQTLLGYTLSNNNTALFSTQPAISSSGVLTFRPAADKNGTATVTVITQDSGGTGDGGVDQATNTFTITVTPVNDAPFFSLARVAFTVLEDSGPFTDFSLLVGPVPGPSNEGSQSITNYSLTPIGNAASLFSVQPALALNGRFTFTPAPNTTGTGVFYVRAFDNGDSDNGGTNGSGIIAITINVTPVNDAPSVTFATNVVAVLEDAGAQTVAGFATGGIGPTNEVGQAITNYTVTSSVPGLFSAGPALALNGTLTFTPAANSNGSATITVIVQDDGGTDNGGVNLATNTFTVTILPVNDPPVVTLASNPVVVAENAGAQTLAAFATAVLGPVDEAGQTVTNYNVANNNSTLFSAQPALSLAGTLTFTPATSATGSAVVTLISQDDGGTVDGGVNKTTNTFTITVSAVNDPPSFAFGLAVQPLATNVTSWGWNNAGQQHIPADFTNAVQIAGGGYHVIGLRSDGTVVGWADASGGSLAPPQGLNSVTAIASGSYFSLALKSDGTMVGWGDNSYGQLDVPPSATDIVGIAAGDAHSLALTRSGQVIGWGFNDYSQTNIPVGLAGVTSISANGYHNLALKSDGTVVAWGKNVSGQSTVPPGLTNVIAVSAGFFHSLALKSDGTVVAWGANDRNQTDVPADLTNAVAIAAGVYHNLALRADGTVVAWGFNDVNQASVPEGLAGVTRINAGNATSFAIGTNVSFGPSITVLEDSGAFTMALAVTNISPGPQNESSQAVTFLVTNSNPDLFGSQPAVAANGTLTFTPALNAYGVARVTVVAQDDGGILVGGVDKATNTFVIVVTPVNDLPSLTFATTLVVVLEDAGAQTVPAFATGGGGLANESGQRIIGYQVGSDNTGLFSTQPAIAADGTLTFTPATNANGSATVTVIAQDSGGTANAGVDTKTNTFTLTVTAVNDAPALVLAISTLGVAEDNTLTVFANLVSSFNPGPANESAQTLVRYLVDNDNPGLFAVPPAVDVNGTLTFQGATNATGTITVSVQAQDSGDNLNGGMNLSAPQTFLIFLQERNDAPSFAFASNNVIALEDAGAVTVPSFIAFSSVGPAQELASQLITNYAVSTTSSSLFSTAPAIATNGTLTFTPALNAFGVATITVVAQDDGGTGNGGVDKATNTFTITITAVNDAPAISFAQPTVTVLEDATAQTVSSFVTASTGPANESGQSITNYAVANNNTALFSVQPAVALNGTLTFTPAANQNGSATVTVIAEDDGGTANVGVNKTTNTFTLAITAVNDAPAISFAQPVVSVPEDEGVQTLASFATVTSVGAVNETGQSITNYAVANNNTALFSVQPAVALDGTLTFTSALDAIGSATVTVVAEDDGGTANAGVNKTTNTFTITITPVNDAPSFAIPAWANWTARDINRNWSAIASSADGTKLVAVVLGDLIYTSTNSGATWTDEKGSVIQDWNAVASSADGTKLVAVANNGHIYTSPDSGATWVMRDSSREWRCVASSADGTKLVAGVENGQLFTSTDSGQTWTPRESTRVWLGVASSDDGTRLVAAAMNDHVYTSADSGQTWTPQENHRAWRSVTSSADGSKLVAAEQGGKIYTSTDYGVTWTARENDRDWYFLASSSDGTKLAGVVNNGLIYTSADSGVTWAARETTRAWLGVAASADGSKFAAVAAGEQIYTATEALILAVLEDSGAYTQPGFATSISLGPVDEAGQSLGFTVTNDNNALFSSQPAVDAGGTLTFTPVANVTGTATVSIFAQDDGGTADRGVDQSPVQTFTITVGAVNDAPGITFAQATVTVLEDAAAQTLPGFVTPTFGPANESGQSITNYSVANNNTALFSSQPAVGLNGTLSFTPAASANGSATVTVIAQDNGGTANAGVNRTTNTFTIAITAVNDAPAITFAQATVTVLEDASAQSVTSFVTPTVGPADESGQSITNYSVANNNTALFLVQPAVGLNGTLSFSPAANANGSATVTVIAEDDGGTANAGVNKTTNTFTIAITAVNDAPAITFAQATVTVLEDASAQSVTSFVTPTVGPVDESGQSITNYAVANDNTLLFSVQPAVALNGTLTFTPAANKNGSATVTVIAEDDGGTANAGVNKTTNTFTIAITAVNDAPSLGFAQATVTVLEDATAQSMSAFVLAAGGQANETAQSITNFSVANNNTALFSTQPAVALNGTLTFTPAANQNGSATVTVIAEDDGGTANAGVNKTTNTFTIAITAVNDAPAITFAQATVTVLEDASAQSVTSFVTPTVGPADESAQSITNYSVANNNTALFSSQPAVGLNGTLSFTPAASANGSATVTVIAEDDGGTANAGVNRTTNTFTIAITAVNDAPGITFAQATVTVLEDASAQSLSAFVTGSTGPANESGQSITNYSVANNNTALFSAQPAVALNGTLTFTPAANANGSATVTVIAEDDGGTANAGVNKTTNTFTIAITAVNDAPAITFAQATVTVLEDASAQSVTSFVTPTVGPADESAQSITNYAVANDNTLLFSVQPAVALNGTLTFTPAANKNGSATVTVIAEEDGGTANAGVNKTTNTFTIAITAVNDAPSLGFAQATVTVLEDAAAQSMSAFVLALGGQANETAQSITNFSVANNNSTLFSVQPAVALNGTLTFTPAANANGSATVTVIAEDDGGTANAGVNKTTNTFTIAITAVNDAPAISFSQATVTVLEDASAQSVTSFVTPTVGPADESGQSITNYTVANNNAALFLVQPAISLDGTLSFTPAANSNGTATVTVIAEDDGGTANAGVNKTTNTFTIAVTAVNDVPSFTLNDGVISNLGSLTGNGASSVLLIWDDMSAGTLALKSALETAGLTVTLSATSETNYTGSNPSPVGFDAVIHLNGSTFTDDMPLAGQNALVSYVQSGGTFIGSEWNTYELDNGRMANMRDLILFDTTASGIGTITYTNVPAASGHPVLTGVPASFSVAGSPAFNRGQVHAFTSNPATVLMRDLQGNAGVAVRFFGAGRVVNYSHSGNWMSQPVLSDANIQQLYVNAAKWNGTYGVTVLEDSGPFTLALAVTNILAGPADESGQVVTFVVTNSNNALFLVQPSLDGSASGTPGTLRFTPATNANGTAIIGVVAHDSGGVLSGGVDASGVQLFAITVTAVNDAPTITFASNTLYAAMDANLQTHAAFATLTAGESSQTITNTFTTNSNPTLFDVQPSFTTAGTLTFTPAARMLGTATITLVVTDNGGTVRGVNQATNTFTISVVAVNQQPNFSFTSSAATDGVQDWVRSLGSSPGNVGRKVVLDSSGNVIVAGEVEAGQTSDIVVVKYAPDGTGQWTNTFNGPGSFYDTVGGLAVDSSGNVFLTGATTDSDNNFVTIKYAANGTPVWTNYYGGIGEDKAAAIVVDQSGDVIVAGSSFGGSYTDYLTIKYASDGTPVWTNRHSYAVAGSHDPRSIAVDSNGDVYVTGEGFSTTPIALTLKFSGTDGSILWTNTFTMGGNSSDGVAVAVDPNGDILVAANYDEGHVKFAVIKYSGAGAPLWTNLYDRGDPNDQGLRAMALDSLGNAIIAGITWNGAVSDYTVIKYLNNGSPAWTNHYSSGFDDQPNALAVNSAGAVFVSGQSGSAANRLDIVTVKYASDGSGVWTNRYDGVNNSDDTARSVAVDTSGNVYVTGTSDDVVRTVKYASAAAVTASKTVLTTAGSVTVTNFIGNTTVGSGESGTQTITNFNVTSDNSALFSVQPAIGTNGTLTFTVSGFLGTAVVSVSAQDDGGTFYLGVDTSPVQTFTITVVNPPGATPLSYIWQGGTGSWRDPAQWLPVGVPGPNDSVTIAGGIVSITNGVQVAGISFSGGTIDGAGLLSLRTNFQWSAGTLTGSGSTLLESGVVLGISGSSSKTLTRRLDNHGTVTFAGTGSLLGNTTDTVIYNHTDGVFDIQVANGTMLGTTAIFTNAGTLKKSVGNSMVVLAAALHSTGTVYVQLGNLSLTGGGTLAGVSTNVSGQVFELRTGTFQWLSGMQYVGAGVGRILTGATVDIATNVTVTIKGGGMQHLGGTLGGAGNVEVQAFTSYIWSGGSINGSGMFTVATNATILVAGSGDLDLGRRLDNYGTVSWSAGRLLGNTGATINNYAGALINTTVDATLFESFDGTVKTLNNYGTVRKSTAAGTSTWHGVFNNNGTVNVQTGTLNPVGTVTLNTSTYSGAGRFLLGDCTVNGTLTNAAGSNVEFASGTLSGTGTVIGTLNWTGGTLGSGGTLTIATNGVLVASGATDKSLNRQLDNRGTITWTGGRIIGDSSPVLNNLAGAVFDNQTDTTLFQSNDGTVKTFNNSGTVKKTAGTGTSTWDGLFNNSGTLNVQTGTIALAGGGSSSGLFTNATTAVTAFTGGTQVLANGTLFTGAGTNQIAGGTVTVVTNGTASVTGTFELVSGVLGGDGTFLVPSGSVFNWKGGVMSGTGTTTNASGGTLTVSTVADKSLNRRLDNSGTVTWTAGRIIGDETPVLNNHVGALFDTQVDATLFESNDGTVKTFNNSGTVRKSAGTGTSEWLGVFNHSGVADVQTGTLHPSGTVTLNTSTNLGPGRLYLTGATINGTITNAAGANVEFASGTLSGTGTLIGTLNWTGGIFGPGGTLTIATNGTLVASGATDKSLNRQLDNLGTITWTAGRIIGDSSPVLNNQAGALFDVQTDARLFDSNDGTVKTFNNSGTVRKSAGTGTGTWNGLFNNASLLSVQSGGVSLAGGGASSGAFTVASGTVLSFTNGTQVLANGVTFSGAGVTRIVGGTVEVVTNGTASVTGTFELLFGVLGGDGAFNVPAGSQFNWNGGTMSGAGRTTIASLAAMTVSGVADKSLNRRLDNNGTVLWTAGRIIGDNTPVLNNNAGAVFETQVDATLFESNDGTVKTFNNSGTVIKSGGTGTSTWNGVFNQSGTLEIRKGIVSLAGDFTPTAGSAVTIYIGGLLAGTQSGQLQVGGTATLTGTLNVVLTNSFLPVVLNIFPVFTSASRSGTFATITGDDLGGNLSLIPSYLLGNLNLVATLSLGLPRLTPQVVGNDLMLRWPNGTGAYELQTATAITGPWTPVTVPVIQENGASAVHLPAEGTRFYRLVPSAPLRPTDPQPQ